MRAKRTSIDEQFQLIMECRESGLSDYQWCKMKNINPGTFYNWISRFRKQGTELPISASSEQLHLSKQEVIKVEFISEDAHLASSLEQNTRLSQNLANDIHPSVEIELGSATLRFFNGADSKLIETTLKTLGGMMHVG